MEQSDFGTTDQGQAPEGGLIDIKATAEICGGCSTRHVRRLADAGKMPAPLKLGTLLRWRRDEILAWIATGCEPVRRVSGKGGRL